MCDHSWVMSIETQSSYMSWRALYGLWYSLYLSAVGCLIYGVCCTFSLSSKNYHFWCLWPSNINFEIFIFLLPIIFHFMCVYLPVASQLEIHLNGYNKFQIWFLAASCFWLLTLSWLMHLLLFEQIQFFFLKYQLRWDCLVIFCLVWWGYIQERWITFLMIAVKLCWR
jgi:hypothetical protein